MRTATCKNCGPLPVKQFYRHSRRGYQSLCITCKAAYNREHYKKDRTKYLARAKVSNQKRREEIAQQLTQYLFKHSCSCGEADPVVLEFHHRDPSQKEAGINQLMYQRGLSWGTVIKEIKKCRVLCANCHRRLHARLGKWKKGRRSG